MQKICCFFNYNPLYRFPIYQEMSRSFDCDFYFGNTVFEPIVSFDSEKLSGYKKTLEAKKIGICDYVWHIGSFQLLNRKYTHYIITGDSRILASWLIMLWAKLTGKKVFLWTHGIHQHYSKWTSRVIYRTYFRLADRLLMYGKYNWSYMIELGCSKNKLRTIHNSLDTNLHNHLFEQMSLSNIYQNHFHNNYPTIIYIGRLQKRKKIEQLFEAVLWLNNRGNRYNIVAVGDDNESGFYQKEAARIGLGNRIWFYGPSYDEVSNSQLLFNASVCVCPAAVGLTAIHAMSFGCPVITNDDFESQMPEHESIIPEITGSYFKTNNIEDLAHKIQFWCCKTPVERENTRSATRKEVVCNWSTDYQIRLLNSCLSLES